jgi:putative DNA methylase
VTTSVRLIEDRLPIEAIGTGASREKSARKGHISQLHLWCTRPPPVLCRAVVYGAVVHARPARPLRLVVAYGLIPTQLNTVLRPEGPKVRKPRLEGDRVRWETGGPPVIGQERDEE